MSEDRMKLLKQTEMDSGTADGNLVPAVVSANSCSAPTPDEQRPKPMIPPPMMRKQTLIRGQALEGTSPPPDSFFGQISSSRQVQNGHILANGSVGTSQDKAEILMGQSPEAKEILLASHKASNDSGHGTIDQNDDASDTSILSRDSSLENSSLEVYRDSSGVDIPKFMRDTLMKSPKDRKTILSYEEQLLDFVNNDRAPVYKMAEMTSYDRMIVHRLAAFLGLDHNVDSSGKCVILNRTKNTRSVKLSELIMLEDGDQEPRKKILLKKPASFDEKHSRGGSKAHFGSLRAKSLEERQQNYIEARERIFKCDENQVEDTSPPQHLLSSNFMPCLAQQPSLDSARSSGQQSSKWVSTESSGYESQKDSSSMQFKTPPNHQPCSQMPGHITTPSDHSDISGPAPDIGQTPVTQMQPHVNADSSLYHFDPTCPPPFMVQPQGQGGRASPNASQIAYQSDGVPDITSRFAATFLGSVDQGRGEPFTVGMSAQPIPVIVSHPQPMYTPVQPQQLTQGQYYVTSSAALGQQPVRYIAVPYHQGQGQQVIQGTTFDGQGQTTVPMPAVGIPAVPGAGGYQVVGSPYQLPLSIGNPPQFVDLNSLQYHYGALPETLLVDSSGGLNASGSVGVPSTPHFLLAYSQPQPQQQHTILTNHQTQFSPTGSTPQGTYYTLPVSAPTPPLTLTQPPPLSQHHHPQLQQHQSTVFYNSSLGNPLTHPIPVSSASSSSSTSLKPVPAPFIQPQYHVPTTSQQQLHQPQPLMVSPSNGHHPAQLTVNYRQSLPFSSSQPTGPVAAVQGSQLVAIQTGPYQVRPLGTTVLQLAGGPAVQTSQLGTGPHLHSYYQLLRPAGPVAEMGMVGPSPARPRLSPLQITSSYSCQAKPKSSSQYRPPKKFGKKLSQDADDYPGAQGVITPHQTGHINIVSPQSCPTAVSHPYSQISSSSK